MQFKNFADRLGSGYGPGVEVEQADCSTLWGCYKFVLCYGLRQGGGIGEVMFISIDWLWLTHITYFLIVILMLLSIIFGIIIDTFSSLRAEKNRRMIDTTEVCFICGIDKQVFDRASDEPDGFRNHVQLDHNMWNYLYYIFMLWEQDRDDDDGLEQYVRKAIEANEITWFPIRKAIRLDQAASEEEVTVKEISDALDALERTVNLKIGSFQAEMASVLEQWSSATRQEYSQGDVKSGIARFLQDHNVAELVVDDAADQGVSLGGSVAGSEDGDERPADGDAEDQGSDFLEVPLHPDEEGVHEDEHMEPADHAEGVEEVFGIQLTLPTNRTRRFVNSPPSELLQEDVEDMPAAAADTPRSAPLEAREEPQEMDDVSQLEADDDLSVAAALEPATALEAVDGAVDVVEAAEQAEVEAEAEVLEMSDFEEEQPAPVPAPAAINRQQNQHHLVVQEYVADLLQAAAERAQPPPSREHQMARGFVEELLSEFTEQA